MAIAGYLSFDFFVWVVSPIQARSFLLVIRQRAS